MNITIRNERVLRWFGFYRAPGCISSTVSMSARMWLSIAWQKLAPMSDREIFFIIGAVVGACGAVMIPLITWPAHPAPRDYAFELPVQFMGCLEYQLKSGEMFNSWRILQPMTLVVGREVHDVRIHNISFEEPCVFSAGVHVE